MLTRRPGHVTMPNGDWNVIYYVNGFPLVVVETKTPVKKQVSWVNAAKDIYGTYEVEYPQFFATNVFDVATEGLDFRIKIKIMRRIRGDDNPPERVRERSDLHKYLRHLVSVPVPQPLTR